MSQREYTAIKTLCAMGFELREVKLALKGLLKEAECDWEYIEENEFSALVNEVLLVQASHSLETTNERIVAESSGSIPHMTQPICTGETVGLDLSDRKGKRPLNERADNLAALKRPKIEVPLMHPPPPENGTTNQRAYAVIKILHDEMGFEQREVKLALNRLLKKTECNWEYIEENSFSALVNAVLLAQESHSLESTSKSIVAESSEYIPHMNQLTSTGEMVELDLKRLKIKVPPVHIPAPEDDNDREAVAIKEMKNMGFEEKDIVPVLDRLLKESHNNWRYIELDNYSALVDGILIPEAASTKQNEKANEMPEHWKYMKSRNLDSGVESSKEESYNWIKPIVPILENAGFSISGCGEILQKTPCHFKELWEPKERQKCCGLGYDSNTSYMMEERPKSGLYGVFVPRQSDVPLAHKEMEGNSSCDEMPAQANQTLSTSAQESLRKF